MPRLTRKSELLSRFEEAVRLSGWNLLYLSRGRHPAKYQVYLEERRFTVKVYIWNITHGGATRSTDEYRIQITGVSQFEADTSNDARTLILGWWEDVGVFAGWDIAKHTGPLGSSPSMQISEITLRQSLITGFSTYVNHRGETAIAFRPDFIATYIEFLHSLHESGAVPAEAALLEKLSAKPDQVDDEQIDRSIAEKRRYAVRSTKKALRAIDFGRRVLGAYDHRCAMCGTQLRLVDGAHILPVSHTDSTDKTSNGIALCALHHRAYDRGLVTFDFEFKIRISESVVKKLISEDRAWGLKEFRAALRPFIILPPDNRDRPAERFVRAANHLRGW